jgi:hypothetical protein
MKTRNSIYGLILGMFVLFAAGCNDWHRVEGNYDLESETRQVPEFWRVSNEGNFDVYIIQDGLSEVTIEAESNLIPLIRTRVNGQELEIDSKEDLRNNYPMKIFVHTAEITDILLSGSGIIQTEDITADKVDVDLSGSGYILLTGTLDQLDCTISGSGDADLGVTANDIDANISGSGEIELWGTSDRGDFKISGSGSINAYELLLQDCYANISGSGNMEVTVQDYLNVNISGSGSVYYMGSPVVETNISGSGNVIHP